MPVDQLLYYFYWAYISVSILEIAGLGAAELVEEARQVSNERKRLKKPYSKVNKSRPWIKVIILSENNKAEIKKSIESVIKNKYRNKEIVIIYFGSKDITKNEITELKRANKNQKVNYVRKSKNSSVPDAIYQEAAKKSRCEHAFVISAGTVINTDAIMNTRHMFVSNSNLDVLEINALPITRLSILSDFKLIQTMAESQLKKLSYLIFKVRAQKIKPGYVYKISSMLRCIESSPGMQCRLKAVYADSVRAEFNHQSNSHQVNKITLLQRIIIDLWAVSELAVMCITGYLAFYLRTPAPMLLAAGMIFAKVALAVFGNKKLNIITKLKLSSLAAAYFLFKFIRAVAEMVAMLADSFAAIFKRLKIGLTHSRN